jgi:hypothetical protein
MNAFKFNNNRLRAGTRALSARGRHATRGKPAIISFSIKRHASGSAPFFSFEGKW